MKGFGEFLVRFETEKSAWGDLAKDVVQDGVIGPEWSVSEVLEYLKTRTQWESVLRTAEEMARVYQGRWRR